jgi:hypothetical protein
MFTVGAGIELGLGAIPEHPVNSRDIGRQDNSAIEQTRREKEPRIRSRLKLLLLPGSQEKQRSDALSRIVGREFNGSMSPHKLVSITPGYYACQIEVPLHPAEFWLPTDSTNGMQEVQKRRS